MKTREETRPAIFKTIYYTCEYCGKEYVNDAYSCRQCELKCKQKACNHEHKRYSINSLVDVDGDAEIKDEHVISIECYCEDCNCYMQEKILEEADEGIMQLLLELLYECGVTETVKRLVEKV